MRFTDEQAAAISIHDRNLIVTAGAGSGKTHVLVERYLALLDAHRDRPLSSIVAITFTEKAAREMRDRVRMRIEARLAEAAARGDSAALDHWLERQAELTTARISTIHTLCAQVLRAHPAEAGIDPGFEVLDENEAAIVLDDAIELALARLSRDDHPAAALLARYDVREVRAVLREYAPSSTARPALEALGTPPETLLDRWRNDWQTDVRARLDALRGDPDWRAALDAVPPGALPPDDKLSDVWRVVHTRRDVLLTCEPDAFFATGQETIAAIKLNVGSAKNWGSKDAVDWAKAALKTVRETLKAWLEAYPPAICKRDEQAARLLGLWRAAIALAAETYQSAKDARAALDFDDLESRARRLLEGAPGVAAFYGEEIRHILVDEFQDTNDAQREIVYRLAGVGRAGAEGRLFVVGDPKQSIYAFRGADVSVFGRVRADFTASGGQDLPLSTSFRTHSRLVAACNAIFGRVLQPGDGPALRYEIALDREMAAHRPAQPGAVALHDAPLRVIVIPQLEDGPLLDERRRWEAWEIAGQIHALVQSGALVWDAGLDHAALPDLAFVPDHAREGGRGAYRPVGYGDVAILFRAMTRAPLYEDVFKAAGLPYVTVAGKGYFDRQEVWDLLHLLRALHDPADNLSLAVALRSPLFGLSDDALYALRAARQPDGSRPLLWDALFDDDLPLFPARDAEARQFARATLDELRDMAGRAPIADLLARALSLTGYAATLTGLSDGARRRGNVEKLFTLARASGRISLSAFNAYAQELTTREVREGEAAVEAEGAVKLMTVHKSKGLEFPVVVLADAAWEHKARHGTLLVDPECGPACKVPLDDPDDKTPPFAWHRAAALADRREAAEHRRLLYVGATRAQDALIVSGAQSKKTRGDSTWLDQWLAALDIDGCEPNPDPEKLAFDWGACVLHVPAQPPPDHVLSPRPPDRGTLWDDPNVRAGRPFPDTPAALPPLMDAIPLDPTAPARALTVTQIARLGSARHYEPVDDGWAAFRHSVLYDMPEPIRPLPAHPTGAQRIGQIIGDMVHRALQSWLLPAQTAPDDLRRWLQTYAWSAGLTDSPLVDEAIRRALDLLGRFEASSIRHEIERAEEVHREVTFVYHTGVRAIHGTIDVLYRDRRGQWHVLDYKTPPLNWPRVEQDAPRYALQVGVYAAAVEARIGQYPQTFLYYIYPGRLVKVKPDDWRAALNHLEEDIRAALDTGR